MSAPEKFQLFVYDGDFSLPSMDPECIKSIFYTNVANIPVQIKLLDNLRTCLFHGIPSFTHKNLRFRTFNEMILYWRTLDYNLDVKLNAMQSSESLALVNYVQAKLRPFLEYIYWVDNRNREEFTNIWFMRALPFFVNYLHIRRFKDMAENLIDALYPREHNNEVIAEYLRRSAVECLSTISTRLGNADYFYGKTPTTLDIVVYAYLAPIMQLPFPSNEISSIVTMWPNLLNYVKKINAKYFPNLPKKSKYMVKEEKPKTSDDDVSYVAILILTVSATSLMLGFAYSRGIISKSLY